MMSPHLQAEQQRLRAQIDAIASSGPIAPPNVRIEADFLNHKCWRLTHTTLPVRERELGVAGSSRHRDWVERIHRRDRLKELEEELAIVENLIERQMRTESIFMPDAPTISLGDSVEFDGKVYRVQDIGLRYLRLVDDHNVVVRCPVESARLLSQSIGG
ncbi:MULTISPECIES: hypothetical protein [unclassified Leptolyngbya]|uniref:hypothetical protein n=1 Tax=unclassified Leptolyngbya TaxID=2650499 RepID=UPI001688E41D|nr:MULTISPECIES: hypothetical protein [unclassified Leptolyngbya]MBD1911002.1 hypothetical protein [Leptolyngbya sp. FACHB-8]MBD2158331.1 hypothetical protein [Leptolyngbya sp. FACHB-16]